MGNIQAKITSSTNISNSNNKGNSEEILRAEVIGIVNEVDDGGVSTSVGGEEVEGCTTIVAIAKDKGRGKLERKRYVVVCYCMLCYSSIAFAMLSLQWRIDSIYLFDIVIAHPLLLYTLCIQTILSNHSFCKFIQFNDTQFQFGKKKVRHSFLSLKSRSLYYRSLYHLSYHSILYYLQYNYTVFLLIRQQYQPRRRGRHLQ